LSHFYYIEIVYSETSTHLIFT